MSETAPKLSKAIDQFLRDQMGSIMTASQDATFEKEINALRPLIASSHKFSLEDIQQLEAFPSIIEAISPNICSKPNKTLLLSGYKEAVLPILSEVKKDTLPNMIADSVGKFLFKHMTTLADSRDLLQDSPWVEVRKLHIKTNILLNTLNTIRSSTILKSLNSNDHFTQIETLNSAVDIIAELQQCISSFSKIQWRKGDKDITLADEGFTKDANDDLINTLQDFVNDVNPLLAEYFSKTSSPVMSR